MFHWLFGIATLVFAAMSWRCIMQAIRYHLSGAFIFAPVWALCSFFCFMLFLYDAGKQQ
jgi:hypothetical protein